MDENKKLRAELESFDLEFFEEVEDLKYAYSTARQQLDSYEQLFGTLPQLEELLLFGNRNISQQAKDTLKAALPNCEVVF